MIIKRGRGPMHCSIANIISGGGGLAKEASAALDQAEKTMLQMISTSINFSCQESADLCDL